MTSAQPRSIKQDEEISYLFENARSKLDKIDAHTQKEKKQIVKDLAKDLEGKIPTDTICIEIVNQLRGRISERFIRECLEEKYKQRSRVENARRQKLQEQQDNENLAALPPLNKKFKNKEIILDVDGRSVQDANQTASSVTDTSTIDRTFAKASNQQQELEKQVNHNLKECSSCKALCSENLELKEALEKASPLITADKVISASSLSTFPPAASTTCDNHLDAADDTLEVEFPLLFRDVGEYVASLSTEIDDGTSKVWFSCKIDKKSGHIISAKTGRIDQQHRDSDNRGDMQNE
jgi:hypothetical protein